MEIPLHERKTAIKRAGEIMKKQNLQHDPLKALIIAENELEEKKKMGEIEIEK